MPFIKARETELAWQAVLEDDEAFEVTSSWKEDCNKIIPLGQKKLGDQRRLATKYGNFVKLRFPDFVGKEWAVEGLRDRIRIFLVELIRRSKGKPPFQHELMAYNSMVGIRWNLLSMMNENTNDPAEATINRDASFQWMTDIQRRFKLRTEKKEKTYFGAAEARVLNEAMLSDPLSFDNSIQHCIANLCELSFGARGSSLYATNAWPNCYLLCRDVIVYREEGRGRFSPKTTLRWFKGHHTFSRLRLTYKLRATVDPGNLDMDIGCYIVALGIRRGMFKNYTTIEELLAGDEYVLEWKDEFLDQPLFLKAKPRGLGVVPGAPMTDQNRRDFLQRMGKKSGLGGSEAGVTIYAFRNNFATQVSDVRGKDVARKGMGHIAGSRSLEGTYDNGNTHEDWVGIMLGEKLAAAERMKQNDMPSLFRITAAPPDMSVDELCLRAPVLLALVKQADALADHFDDENENEDWKACLADPNVALTDDDDLFSVYLWTRRRIKRLVQREKERFLTEWRTDQAKATRNNITRTAMSERRVQLQNLDIVALLAQSQNPQSPNQQFDDGDADNDEDEELEVTVRPLDGDTTAVVDDVDKETRRREQFIINLATAEERKPTTILCELCVDDITAPEGAATRDWVFNDNLQCHLAGGYHGPDATARRLYAKLLTAADGNRPNRDRVCCWCQRSDPLQKHEKFRSIAPITVHVFTNHKGELDPEEWTIISDHMLSLQAPVVTHPKADTASTGDRDIEYRAERFTLSSEDNRFAFSSEDNRFAFSSEENRFTLAEEENRFIRGDYVAFREAPDENA